MDEIVVNARLENAAERAIVEEVSAANPPSVGQTPGRALPAE